VAKKLEDYLKLEYEIELVTEETTDGGICFAASHPELPGCMTHGNTKEEALRNLDEVRQLYIRTLLKRGIEIPPPAKARPKARV
jgi:antitoxin HicB